MQVILVRERWRRIWGVRREEGHGKTEADAGVRCLQAKDWGQPAEAGREASNGLSLGVSRRGQPCFHLDFRLLASRMETENILVVSGHPACDHSLQQPQGTWLAHRRNEYVSAFQLYWWGNRGSEKPATVPVRSVTRRVGWQTCLPSPQC